MSALHIIAEWVLIVGGGLLVLVLVGAAVHLAALAVAVGPPEPAVRMRCHRGRDGVVRRYTVVRRGGWDEWYPG